ncbi:MAG: glycosyltransferase family 4 protein [Planctomycetota bacterium]
MSQSGSPITDTPIGCCVISPFTEQRGGAELSLIHLLEGGAAHGVNWSLAVPRDGEIAERARAAGLDVTLTQAGRLRDVVGYVRSVARVRSAVRRNRAKLVLAWMPHSHWWGLAAASAAGVPSAWFQKDRALPDRRSTRLTSKLPCRGILANSPYTARLQAKMSPNRPIHIVPSAVDLGRFDPDALGSPADCRRALGLRTDVRLVGLVGRLQIWKGIDTAIRAIARLGHRAETVNLVVVGGPHPTEPDHRATLHSLATELAVADRIHFAGRVPHEEVPRYMQACDLMLHASRLEPFGIVVLEAMALGKPLVAADDGGPRDTVTHGRDGLLAPFGDPEAVAACLGRLLDNPDESARLASAARTTAASYSIDIFRRRAADAIRSLLRPTQPGVYLDGNPLSEFRV